MSKQGFESHIQESVSSAIPSGVVESLAASASKAAAPYRPFRMNGTKTSSTGPREWAQLAGANRFREAERVAAVQLDVLANQR